MNVVSIADAVAGAERTLEDELLERLNQLYFVVLVSAKTRIGSFPEFEGRKQLTLMTFKDFRDFLNHNKLFDGRRYIGHGAWWLDHPQRRQYNGLCFRPGEASLLPDNRLNLWQGWGIEPKKGDWSLLKQHIVNVLSAGDLAAFRYIFHWTAWALQNPGQIAEVALVFTGGRGAGKGMFGRALKSAFGQHGQQISSADHLVGHFNHHLMDCALLFADEAYWPGHKAAEGTIKRMITEPTLIIEPKGVNAFEVMNCLKIVMATNSEWVVPAGLDERRFAVFEVDEVRKQSLEYFGPLYEEMEAGGIAAMMYDLIAYDLRSWHPRDSIPKTAGLLKQKMHTLSPEDQWWLSLLESGELPMPGFRDHHNASAVNARRARSDDLFRHARETVPALKGKSGHALSGILKKYGCNRNGDYRIDGRRAWEFPPLAEARAAWSALNPTKWETPDDSDWVHSAF